ncbi:glycosyltransferase family 4 protein [Streptomyces sp. NPDC059627]
MSPRVATALDLPFGSAGGSVELFLDLYTGENPLLPARAFMLAPAARPPRPPAGVELLSVPGKCLSGPPFRVYVNALRRDLAHRVAPSSVDVLHLQHLAFGGTPALMRALPTHPRIALVHGTDLLFAEAHKDQHQVLQEAVRAADAIVVPTGAMADHLLKIVPTVNRRKITRIPWGIPDHLLTAPPPRHQFHGLTPLLRLLKVHVRYLGWLTRPQLWKAFADHDALVMPSTTLEAMGLVALEAQACGLPVIYQPVPGLNDTLAATGLATDFTNPTTLAQDLNRLRSTLGLLPALQAAGRTNAARYPLSATAAALNDLGKQLT